MWIKAVKKLTSERLGREGLAAWGAPRQHENRELPDIKEESPQGEITFIVDPPPVIQADKCHTDNEEDDTDDCQQAKTTEKDNEDKKKEDEEEPLHQQGLNNLI